MAKDLRIYNLFPRLYKNIEEWYGVAYSAKDMGFNALYINPFLRTGETNSIYAINDYYRFDSQIFSDVSQEEAVEKIKGFLHYCKELGLKPIFDLVINHTSMDSHLIQEHGDWYQRDEQGEILPAITYTADKIIVTWGDCAKLDYSNKESGLWEYVEQLCRFYLDLGFDGFRCDVACHIPSYYWQYLIQNLHKDYPNALFIGEAFLASAEELLGLEKAGFNYIFNSAKWWDYEEPWFFEQNELQRIIIPNIGFPDNHDTERSMYDYNGNLEKCIQKLFFTAIVSSGFMMTNGFEYGFREKLDVHVTDFNSWEETGIDIRMFVKEAIGLRKRYRVFRQEGCIKRINYHMPKLTVLLKAIPGQAAVLFFNRGSEGIILSKENMKDLPYYEYWEEKPNVIDIKDYGFTYQIINLQQGLSALENDSLFLVASRQLMRRTTPLFPLIEGEVLVKVSACGICGSDYYEFQHGPFYWKPCYTGGHELSGTVKAVGKLVDGISVGDKVIYRIPRKGSGIIQGGGYSKYAVIKSGCLFKLEKRVRPDMAVMIEPLAAVIHGSKLADAPECHKRINVAICGSGTIALLMERYLHIMHPEWHITLFYKHSAICSYVSAFTCCQDVNSEEGIDLQFTCVFECSGDASNISRFLFLTGETGQIILMGIYGRGNPINYSDMMFLEKKIQGSFLYTEQDFFEASQLVCEKILPVQDLVVNMPFDDYENAFEKFSDIRIKTVLCYTG